MIPAPIPANEADRVASLHRMNLLSSPREADLDRITRVAQKLFGTEISLISLVDHYRQWFKSRIGLSAAETPRDISFCTHTILGEEVFEITDATSDQRFVANPAVTGEPKVRFYAGAPLIDHDGFALGSMCVVDKKVRKPLDERRRQVLVDLAGLVVDLMETHKLRRKLRMAG